MDHQPKSKAQSYYAATHAAESLGAERGLKFLYAKNGSFDGRLLEVNGRSLVSFASCSYLGLETDARLKQGAIDATLRYGTQFSYSRGFISAPPYEELESLLDELFDGHVVISPNTRLAHQSALPVLVEEGDVVLRDRQVHESARAATDLLRHRGIPVIPIEHNRPDLAEEQIRRLQDRHRRIWYIVDGIYSMFGDPLPSAELTELLTRHEQLQLYVDDAHGMGWYGRHGRGYAPSKLPRHPRLTLVTSLNKSFAAAGGAIVLPDIEAARRVRRCAMPLLFSGPIQPPMLGAAVASARLHLSDEITALQAELRTRIDLFNGLLRERRLTAVSTSVGPIRFVVVGTADASYDLSERLLAEGLFVGAATYPAVPADQCGLRLTITRHQTPEDLRRLVDALANHLPKEAPAMADAWPELVVEA